MCVRVFVCMCFDVFWGGCVALQSCVRDVDSRNSRKIFENRTSVDDRERSATMITQLDVLNKLCEGRGGCLTLILK